MPDNEPQTPGLSIWIALLVACGCLALFIARLPSREQMEKDAMQSWILTNTSVRSDSLLILVLGTSLTGSGLDSMRVLEKQIGLQSGKPVRVLKLWKLDAAPATFGDMSAVLQHLRPAAVIVEANMLFYSFEKKKGWPVYTQRFRGFINGKKEEYLPDAKPIVVRRKLEELETFRTGLHDTTNIATFRNLLAAWQKNGSSVTLLNFPLESALETRKWHSADTGSFYRNLNYLRRRCVVAYRDPKEKLDESYFIDHAHMSTRGQQKQSLYFSNTTSQQLTTK